MEKNEVTSIRFDVARTRFTENEVFGTGCGECGWQSFERETPRYCARCASDNMNPLDGCSVPYDDNHTRREVETFSSVDDAAQWLRDNCATEYDGRVTFTDPDGSRVTDYASGEREEISVRVADGHPGPMFDLAATIAEVIA